MQKVAVLLRGACRQDGRNGPRSCTRCRARKAAWLLSRTLRGTSFRLVSRRLLPKTPPKLRRRAGAAACPVAPAASAAANPPSRPQRPHATPPAGRPSATDAEVLTPQAVDDILEFELTPDVPDLNKSATAARPCRRPIGGAARCYWGAHCGCGAHCACGPWLLWLRPPMWRQAPVASAPVAVSAAPVVSPPPGVPAARLDPLRRLHMQSPRSCARTCRSRGKLRRSACRLSHPQPRR